MEVPYTKLLLFLLKIPGRKFCKNPLQTILKTGLQANFLTYANTLRVVRTANTGEANNAVSNGNAVLVRNDAEYQNTASLSVQKQAKNMDCKTCRI